ncbi:ankyrin repeat protein [Trichoderma velutinum]
MNSVDSYKIGWIAALPIERAAALAVLDERYEAPEGFEQHPTDTNSYIWGRIDRHNVVIASFPAGVPGTRSAAVAVARFLASLPHIRIGLLVGIGAGVARPDLGQDIRLGDVVVSQPGGQTGGVIQYDLGKAKIGQVWERKGILNTPPLVLLHAVAALQAEHEVSPPSIPITLKEMWINNAPLWASSRVPRPQTQGSKYIHQGFENDRLFKATFDHVEGGACVNCDPAYEIKREARGSEDPWIHYGIIASGDTIIEDAATRDKILKDVGEEILCFDTVAAGVLHSFPCLVIRGICDYADSHRNDQWQRYAAATAAAYAKELFDWIPGGQHPKLQPIHEIALPDDTPLEPKRPVSRPFGRQQYSGQSLEMVD